MCRWSYIPGSEITPPQSATNHYTLDQSAAPTPPQPPATRHQSPLAACLPARSPTRAALSPGNAVFFLTVSGLAGRQLGPRRSTASVPLPQRVSRTPCRRGFDEDSPLLEQKFARLVSSFEASRGAVLVL